MQPIRGFRSHNLTLHLNEKRGRFESSSHGVPMTEISKVMRVEKKCNDRLKSGLVNC